MLRSCKARVSSSRSGKPVPFGEIVPGKDRFNYKHRLYWSRRHHSTAERFNCIVENYRSPCTRRWLEYIGGRVPKTLQYRTAYSPATIIPRPRRYWILKRDGEEISYFTNCIEAWLVCVSANFFKSKEVWTLVYVER